MTELLSKTESNNNKNINSNKFNVLFLGTGVSTAIPNIQHVLNNSLCNPCTNSNENSDSVTNSDSNDADDSNSNDKSSSVCKVCIDAMNNPLSKNRRNNVSIAITFDVPNNTDTNTANSMANSVPNNAVTNTTKKCILIDVGKTMRDACITKLPAVGVSKVDGIVLTHGHADAVFGLDDVRDLQQAEKFEVIDSNGTDSTASIGTTGANSITKSIGFKIKSGPLPIYLNQETMAVVQNCFGYLTGKPDFLDEKNLVLKRRVALLDFQLIESNSSFFISGLPIKAFPVYHGGTYVSLG